MCLTWEVAVRAPSSQKQHRKASFNNGATSLIATMAHRLMTLFCVGICRQQRPKDATRNPL